MSILNYINDRNKTMVIKDALKLLKCNIIDICEAHFPDTLLELQVSTMIRNYGFELLSILKELKLNDNSNQRLECGSFRGL